MRVSTAPTLTAGYRYTDTVTHYGHSGKTAKKEFPPSRLERLTASCVPIGILVKLSTTDIRRITKEVIWIMS
jgi:hypothetical protein